MPRPDPIEPQPGDRPDPRLAEIRRRQTARAVVMAVALGAFVILIYAISIAKMVK